MKKIIACAALAALACGCVSVNKNDGGDDCLKQPIVKDVIHEKYSVSNEQVTAQDQIYCLFGWICWGSSATHIADQYNGGFGMIAKAKNGAYANACDAGQCDQLVGTHYTVTTDDYFVYAKCKAEVKGYPAKITGVEVIEDKNTEHAVMAKPAAGGLGIGGLL